MSLINCPECGKEVSDRTPSCIYCGYPLAEKIELAKVEKPKNPKTKKKIGIVISLALLIVLGVAGYLGYVMWYVPGYTPQEVESLPVIVEIDGKKLESKFTGIALSGVPQGEGIFTFDEDDGMWTFSGTLSDDGTVSTGNVKNKTIIIDTPKGGYSVLYSGKIEGGKPVESFYVEEMPVKCICDDISVVGNYTGDVLESQPHGSGKFTYKSENDFFLYEGGWENGLLKGEGKVHTNMLSVHFSDVDRLGEYEGDMLDGVFCGEGVFKAINGEKISYTYTGNWKNGLFNGQGTIIYDSDAYNDLIGTYIDGEFCPTISDWYISRGTYKDEAYNVSDYAKDYLNNHNEMFIGNNISKLKDVDINNNFDFNAYAKNPDVYSNGIIEIPGLKVFQIFENEDYWGYKHTAILADKGDQIYYIDHLSHTDIANGDTITLYALPLDYFTYPNVAGTKIWAIRCAAVCVK